MKTPAGSQVRAVPEEDERRQHQRIEPEGGRVDFMLAGERRSLGIDNLSEGGALIAGRIGIEPGSSIALRIRLPGTEVIELTARVLRHVARAGQEFTAVKFLSTSDLLGNWIADLVLEGLRAAFPEL